MPGRLATLTAVVLLLALARPASALSFYWTTNPATADTDPALGGWNDAGANNDGPQPLPTSLTANEPDIWLGFRNTANPVNRKFLHVRFTLTPGNLFTTAYSNPEGFATSDASQPVPLYSGAGGGLNNDENYDLNWQFDGQPKWERLRIARANSGAVNGLSWSGLEANSMCTNLSWVDPLATFDNSSFDAPGATGGSEESGGTPHIKEIWIFPFGPFGPRIRIEFWTFVAPPSTGTWDATFVYTDPEGNPRPHGGIKFTCTGSGLTTSDNFDAQIQVDGGPSYLYDVYAFNVDNGQYRKNVVRAGLLGAPGVAGWTLLVLAIAMVVTGALFARRTRTT